MSTIFHRVRDWVTGFFRADQGIKGESSLKNVSNALFQSAFGRVSKSSVPVTETNSITYTAFFGAMKVFAQTEAMLPIILYKRTADGKERAIDHPLFNIIHLKPNSEQTAYEFFEMLGSHRFLFGNAYAEIVKDGLGNVVALWPLVPWRIRPARLEDGTKVYEMKLPNGKTTVFSQEKILHIKGLTLDGMLGLNPVEQQKDAIGLGLATEYFGSTFFANDARPGGVIEFPQRLNKPTVDRLRRSWNDMHADIKDSHRIAILEEGAQFKALGLDPEHAQFLETRKFQVTEIARATRIPPHLLGDLERATFSNIEQQALEFVTYTMTPEFTRIQQALTTQLLTQEEVTDHFFEYVVNALVKADIKTRYEVYRTGLEISVLNADEVRDMENMNRLPDGMGQKFYRPLNWVEVGNPPPVSMDTAPEQEENQRQPGVEKRTAKSRFNIAFAFRDVYRDIMQKIVKKEVADLRKAVKNLLGSRDLQQFNDFLDRYYAETLPDFIRKRITGVYMSIQSGIRSEIIEEVGAEVDFDSPQAFITDYVTKYITRYVGLSKSLITQDIQASIAENLDIDVQLEERFNVWENKRADSESIVETTRASNAFARTLYLAAGITALRWVAIGDNCPLCNELDGKTVGIEKTFVAEGEEVNGGDKTITAQRAIGHPPLHNGCDCQIIAG